MKAIKKQSKPQARGRSLHPVVGRWKIAGRLLLWSWYCVPMVLAYAVLAGVAWVGDKAERGQIHLRGMVDLWEPYKKKQIKALEGDSTWRGSWTPPKNIIPPPPPVNPPNPTVDHRPTGKGEKR